LATAMCGFEGIDKLDPLPLDGETNKKKLNSDQVFYREHFSKLQIHQGFAKYMLSRPTEDLPNSKQVEKPKGRNNHNKNPKQNKEGRHAASMIITPTKCDFILEQVQDILLEYPTYRVNTTGHSLGGALATLFAMKACIIDSIPKPVTCINFGSPKVGNSYFRRAISHAEEKGTLRHLRVVNHYDPVPKVPKRSLNSICGLQVGMCDFLSTVYCHVGAKLYLRTEHHSKITYGRPVDNATEYVKLGWANSKKTIKYLGWWFTKGGWGFGGLRAHSCLHYYQLMEEQKEALQKSSMNEIYESIQTRDKSLDEIGSSVAVVNLRVSLSCNKDASDMKMKYTTSGESLQEQIAITAKERYHAVGVREGNTATKTSKITPPGTSKLPQPQDKEQTITPQIIT
jgi:hypothetical protein